MLVATINSNFKSIIKIINCCVMVKSIQPYFNDRYSMITLEHFPYELLLAATLSFSFSGFTFTNYILMYIFL